MIKEILKEKEPIAYLSLKNDFENKKIAHSYLLTGDLNPLKLDTAFLIAQSIVENNNSFACEECNTCKRIKNGSYYDVIYIDGYKSLIKKDDIERMMEQFNQTALEKANKKIYIVSNINNSSDKVLNMILKFMEEPANENTFGIFITDNVDTLLETIVSRCQKIPFITKDFTYAINEYEKAGFEYVDAYLLSNILHRFNSEIDTDNYNLAKDAVFKTIDNLNNKKYLPVMFSKEFFEEIPKESIKECTNYYLDIIMKMIEDAISKNYNDSEEYKNYIEILRAYDLGKLLNVVAKAKKKSISSVDRKLLFDQIAFEILSYI